MLNVPRRGGYCKVASREGGSRTWTVTLLKSAPQIGASGREAALHEVPIENDKSMTPHVTERRFVGNAAIATVLHFASSFVILAITPVLVGRLGLEAYGLWALLNTVIRYSLLADFGIGPSLSKHVAQFAALGDNHSIRATTTVGMVYLTLTGAIALTGAALVGPIAFAHLPMSESLRPVAPGLLNALVGSVALNFALGVSPSATLTGLGHYRLTSAINAVGTVAFALIAVVLEFLGHGLNGLVFATYVQTAITAVLGFVVLGRVGGGVLLSPFAFGRALYGSILRFGGWVQISAVASLVIADTPAVVVGFAIGVEYVGILDIATRLTKAVRALAYNFNNALMPAISHLDAEAGADRVRILLPRATRCMGLLALASSGGLIASAPFLLRVWIGPHLPQESLMLIVLATFAWVYAVETMTGTASAAALGVGRPSLLTASTVAYAAASLLATLVLVRLIGLEGVAVAALFGSVTGSVVFFRAASATPSLRFSLLIGRWLFPAVVAVAIAGLSAWAAGRPLEAGATTRWEAMLDLVIVALVYLIVLAFCARVFRVIDIRDLEQLRGVLPKRLMWLVNARITRVFFARV